MVFGCLYKVFRCQLLDCLSLLSSWGAFKMLIGVKVVTLSALFRLFVLFDFRVLRLDFVRFSRFTTSPKVKRFKDSLRSSGFGRRNLSRYLLIWTVQLNSKFTCNDSLPLYLSSSHLHLFKLIRESHKRV